MREKANAQTGEIAANGLNSEAKIRNVGFGTLQMRGTTNDTLWTNCGPTEAGFLGCRCLQVRHPQGFRFSDTPVRDQGVGGSNPLAPTTSKILPLIGLRYPF